ncbi:MAG: hypothetical protein IJ549_07900 [Prevotella sp.]|nr:hypothetical protein [Prevotella sp.]MBQ8702664.1 hypothetical protein [Prevotella sp.]
MKSLRMLLALFLIVLSTQGVWADKVTPTLELTPVDGEGWLDNDYKQVYPSWEISLFLQYACTQVVRKVLHC